MQSNTKRSPASMGGCSALKSGWEPLPSEVWHEVAEHLPKPWTPGQAAHDLRVYLGAVKTGRRAKLPGRPTLRARWGWTDHRVRTLLRDSDAWGGFTTESPAHRQPVASAPPAFESKEQVSTEAVASASPAHRQPISTGAELHTSYNTPHTDSPPKGPPPAEPGTSPQPADSPVENQGALIEAAAAPKPKRTRRTALTVEAILEVEVPPVLKSLSGFEDRWGNWIRVKQKGRGRFIEARQVASTLSKLARYCQDGLDVLEGLERAYERSWQGFQRSYLNPLPLRAVAQENLLLNSRRTDAEAVWQEMIAIMGRVGSRRLPTAADAPSLDEATLKRALLILGGAAQWPALCGSKSDHLHFQVRPRFVRRWREVA